MKMGLKKDKSPAGEAIFLILLAWLVYSTSYLGKVNYSANITQIIDFYGVTKAQAGAAPTFLFFSYGAGQIFNGLFCKKYNIKWMIFASLFASGSINLIIAITTNFAIIKWMWLINGIALSVLWPTLIRLISENIPQKGLATSSVIIGTTVATGTLVIYGLSSLYAHFNSFKLSFYTAAFAMIAVAIFWFFSFDKVVMRAKREKDKEEIDIEKMKEEIHEEMKNYHAKIDFKVFYACLCVLCFCAIGVNLIKDGLATWVPSILKDEFSMKDSLSILLTLFLPVLAIFANAFAITVHKKIPDYVNHSTLIFMMIAVVIGVIIGSLSIGNVIFMLVGLIAANFFASSLNSLITSIYPLFMRGKVNSGLVAGVLNGFCYLGSTLSSYGLGAIADGFGWPAVFYTLLSFCGLVFVAWGIYSVIKHCAKEK